MNEILNIKNQLVLNWCNIDRLFYVELNGQEIHHQQTKPTDAELLEAYLSDQWQAVFDTMRTGERVRVSERVYYEMLGAVPPKKQTATSFYCGEPYSGSLYYYFEKVEGKCYGQLKKIN